MIYFEKVWHWKNINVILGVYLQSSRIRIEPIEISHKCPRRFDRYIFEFDMLVLLDNSNWIERSEPVHEHLDRIELYNKNSHQPFSSIKFHYIRSFSTRLRFFLSHCHARYHMINLQNLPNGYPETTFKLNRWWIQSILVRSFLLLPHVPFSRDSYR